MNERRSRKSPPRLDQALVDLPLVADFLRLLARGGRPLPTFATLHDVLFERPTAQYWFSREDEWADAPAALSRYSVVARP